MHKASAFAMAIASVYPGMVRQPYQLAQADASGAAAGAAGADPAAAAAAGAALDPKSTNGSGGITPEIQALINAGIEKEVQGLKTKNGELLGKLKDAEKTMERFTGIDPDAVRGMLAKIANDEEAKLMAAGKLDEAFELRTQRMQQGHQADLKSKDGEIEKERQRADRFTARVFENAIRGAALDAGVIKEALNFGVVDAAARMFELNSDGEVVARDGSRGKDGQPLALKEWFADMKEKAPMWWPAPQGTGASGSAAPGGPKSIKRSALEKLDANEQMRIVVKERYAVID